MSQFINTEHANQAAKESFKRYRSDQNRITEIENKIKNGETISPQDILWLCGTAKHGIRSEESSWYDHC